MTGTTFTGRTKVLGVIGWPLAHSLSPLMHNAALAALGLDYAYVPFPIEPGRLAEAVTGLRYLGVAGFNVTIPHKQAILPLLDELSPEARECGAVNTVAREGERLVGYNTDGTGLVASLREDLGMALSGARVLMLGAGGAARGAVGALCRAGVGAITVANRTPSTAADLSARFRPSYPGVVFASCALEGEQFGGALRSADLLLNTTSVGMEGTSFDGLDLGCLPPAAAVYDMVYAPLVTPLLVAAAARRIRCSNGLGMLAAQGEAAFTIWTGVSPPQGLMKTRLLAVLASK
jgi:shikimate dehydrogenase